MEIGNIIVILLMMYYTRFTIRLFKPSYRNDVKQVNNKLDNLRQKSIKTLEEQKEFINTKYPKTAGTFKFKFEMIPKTIMMLFIYICIFKLYKYLFNTWNINIHIWQAILLIIFVPSAVNFILRRFNLHEGSDLETLIKWK